MKNEVVCVTVNVDRDAANRDCPFVSLLAAMGDLTLSQYRSDMLCPHFRGQVSLKQDESQS